MGEASSPAGRMARRAGTRSLLVWAVTRTSQRRGRGWIGWMDRRSCSRCSRYPQATARGTTSVARPRRVSTGFGGAGVIGRGTYSTTAQVYVYRRRRWLVHAQFRLNDQAGNCKTNLHSWSDHFSRLHHFPFFKMALLLMEQMGQGFSMREDFGKERPPLPPYICSS